jgi:uncharacterized protein YcfJ
MARDEVEDIRARRRDLTCAAAGLLTGGGVGALAGVFFPAGVVILTLAGAVIGGAAGRAVARRISADDWDPPFNRRAHVGASSPDDDIASA